MKALSEREATFAIAAARVATPGQLLRDGFVVVGGGSVLEVGQGPPPAALTVVDLGDVLVAPGFVDLHVHGGGGAQVNCPTREEVAASVWRMARFHARHGTTAMVATTVSDSPEALQTAVEGVALMSRGEAVPSPEAVVDGVTEATAPGEPGAVVLGCNLEGPWIARSRAGAQFPDALRLPSVAELDDLVDRGKGTVRIVTLAPELEGAMEVIAAARSAGVVVSIGHTDTDYATARKAFDAGARHATHLFNAMAPIHHRRPGPVAAALVDDRVSLEIIADGVHIHPALISLVATLAPERLVLVTDAIGATGTPPGRHRLGPLEVLVQDGRAVLAGHQETAAGSVLTMDRAVALTVQVAGVPLLTALQAASLHPANVLGEQRKGRLAPGADADLVVLDNDLALVGTVVGGQVAHDPLGVLAPLEMTASRARLP
ncbi:MAG TPA: N-acetylglucosamine-6-phosphate deacetylase [Acidimicrobiales bacterium]|nr:N-acetylglucosamine-6-phosphate deacetylase [Acidimicrobiales bacterium]